MGLRRLLGTLRAPSKADAELRYWRAAKAGEGTLYNAHYAQLFTEHFGLTPAFFAGRRILDVGCGPRGSLEWATMAAERVGVDPLAGRYRALGIDAHAMRYVEAPAERLPFADRAFDVVTALNALDHVDDVDRAIAEMTRVAAPGATLLVTVEVRHAPTPTEPHDLDWDVVDRFTGWEVQWTARNGVRADHGVFASIDDDLPYIGGPGLLRARMRRSA